MTGIRYEDGRAVLEGVCTVEEADSLLEWLQDDPRRPVDWTDCDHLHTAVLQVLLAVGPPLIGEPRDPFLARWVAPRLREGAQAGPARDSEEGAQP